jgi:uncharacterized protein YjbI with pentapeptide repeats
VSVGLVILATELHDRTWDTALIGLATELAGAAVTYVVLQQVVGSRAEKDELIAQMGSDIKDVAVPAADELRQRSWLIDGSLQRAHLRRANLKGAELVGARLEQANLEGARLQGVEARGVDLHGANLEETDLRAANLQGAVLSCATLQGADLSDANLKAADLDGAELQ